MNCIECGNGPLIFSARTLGTLMCHPCGHEKYIQAVELLCEVSNVAARSERITANLEDRINRFVLQSRNHAHGGEPCE